MEAKRKLHDIFMERFKGRVATIDKNGYIGAITRTAGLMNKFPKSDASFTQNETVTCQSKYNQVMKRSCAFSMPSMLIFGSVKSMWCRRKFDGKKRCLDARQHCFEVRVQRTLTARKVGNARKIQL